MLRWLLIGSLSLALVVATLAAGQTRRPELDSAKLATALGERQFRGTESFKAVVVEARSVDGNLELHSFDWSGTSNDREDWLAGSSFQLYAAIAALEKVNALGFDRHAWLTVDYEGGALSGRVDQLVRSAVQDGDARAFDGLVDLVGFDELNAAFFVPAKGFEQTVITRGRIRRSTRTSPALRLRRALRERDLPERQGRGTYECPEDRNCTTLRELAEAIGRVMLHEELPESERFALSTGDLALLRDALQHATTGPIAARLAAGFGAAPVQVYHQAGEGGSWKSELAFIHDVDGHRRWAVAMAAAEPSTLAAAASALGRALADGALAH